MLFEISLIFLLLALREIEDGPDRPRGDGIRRGELWRRISFQISQLPILLCKELEKMSRGKSRIVVRVVQDAYNCSNF